MRFISWVTLTSAAAYIHNKNIVRLRPHLDEKQL